MGVVLTLIGALFIFLRIRTSSQEQKEILKNANEAHRAELRLIKDHQDKLDDGLEEISSDHKERIERIENETETRREELDREKRELIEREKEADDLARKLADAIGADFVETADK